MRRKIFLVLTILWMITIFAFSSRPGELSSRDSGQIGMLIGKVFVPEFNQWSEEEQKYFAEEIDYPIRKTAHAMEYTVLGILTMGLFMDQKQLGKKRFLLAWLLASGYAVTDELHQLFVPERSCRIFDVMVDSAGALAGVLILLWIERLRYKRNIFRER